MKEREYINRTVGSLWPRWVRDKYFAVEPNSAEPSEVSMTIENKWKVYYFYPKDFTFVCPTEIVDFDNLIPEFEKLNAVVFGISPDNEYCKLAWKQSNPLLTNLQHTLLVDSGNELAKECGIATSDGTPLRATFIVDPQDDVQHVSVNNHNVGRNAAEILRILDACQKGSEGALCPANRQVGGETL
jgi:peroxiredoxin (alkyl hydroperoxide reductase subunit C)